MLALGPLMDGWHPVLRALLLTLLVVPTAVYVVVPRLFAAHGKLAKRRAALAARKQA
jgi:antibiotic biosynthesis monooxygenase (ABM) superfamily enzyme